MNRPKWLESYIQSKPGVKDQITVLGNKAMPGVMNTGMRNMGGMMYMGAGSEPRCHEPGLLRQHGRAGRGEA
jgi:hypothetical protein